MLQRQARDLLVGSSLLLLPVVAINLWATTQVVDGSGSFALTAFGGDAVGTGIEEVAAVLAVVCASLAAAVVGLFAATILIADRFGQPTTLRAALRSTLRRLPAVLVAWLLSHVWVPLFALWALSGRAEQVGGRLFLAAMLGAVFTSITLFVVPVLVAEGRGPFAGLRRSWRLFRMASGTALGFVLVSSLLGSLLLAGIAAVPALLQTGGFITFGDYLWLAQGITGQLGVIIVVPLIALATAYLYVLVRLDVEGLDIVIDADRAFGRRTPTSVGTGSTA